MRGHPYGRCKFLIDTANIMVKTDAEVRKVHIGLDRKFRSHGIAKYDTRETGSYIKLGGTGKYRWIKDIKAENRTGAGATIIFVQVSYAKFFREDNKVLIGSEAQRKQVNKALKELLEDICRDDVYWATSKYVRVDVAQEFEDIFEEYYNVFDVLYRIHYESLGNGNRESKKFLQEEFAIEPRDYTTGYRYKKGEYVSTMYNKDLQMNPKRYKPFGKSRGRIEQAFSHKVLGKRELLVEDTTMTDLRKLYKEFSKKVIVEKINEVLKRQSDLLYDKLFAVLQEKNPKLKAAIKDMTHLILDEEQVLKAIHHMPLNVKDRQKRYYKNWAKESLGETSGEGQFKRTFQGNFDRMIKIIYLMTGSRMELTWENHIPKLILA